jgi:cob(I)alamin adenosyltransferase
MGKKRDNSLTWIGNKNRRKGPKLFIKMYGGEKTILSYLLVVSKEFEWQPLKNILRALIEKKETYKSVFMEFSSVLIFLKA